ncbi:glycosyltransferase family 4 protein [Alkalihalobacillus sp. LMS6]|uniref:glycosyltransferase family 4 protein n=1 Tax=Alkalihalobacillus sp. LMS6 TaxID=2924034 RepID=UPI0020D0D517|nr:glycosyltransferase family 4 protein [Alkalihalobacillus sp. LMS6]UTR06079.1 glycosyltransferase family 4 protein [Alkalihalobacillus sp. LMS6]
MKVCIVHDWLVTYAGAEKVLEEIIKIYPDADLFSIVDFLDGNNRSFIGNKQVKTTFIQKLPFSKKRYRQYLPLMPIAIEQLDVSEYDVIISSSHAVAKGIITGPDQLHISYVHSPIRYAWDLQHQYFKEANLNKGLKGIIAKSIMHYMRIWDYRTANGVDYFLSNSEFIGKRIKKVYGRESLVVYPPVDISSFSFQPKKENYYVTASRMVPYKKMDLIVEAFSNMPEKKLIVIGDGPDFKKIESKASSNIQLLGYQSFDNLISYMQRAKAFVFAAEEDFGITPVEAQACGTPVIAFGKGGSLETVKNESTIKTGVFFYNQDVPSIVKAVEKFEAETFDYQEIREHALKFSPEVFQEKLRNFVQDKYDKL